MVYISGSVNGNKNKEARTKLYTFPVNQQQGVLEGGGYMRAVVVVQKPLKEYSKIENI